VLRQTAPVLMLLVLACGGPGQTIPQDNATTPEIGVRDFMQAVTDSNIARMGRYWGTARGPAAETRQPPDYEQRLAVTQAFLRVSPFRVLRADPVTGDPTRSTVEVEFTRNDLDGKQCTRVVQFVMVNAGKRGWIVTAIDLTQVGTPGRSCTSPAKAG